MSLCVAVCCSALLCVVACCCVLLCVAVSANMDVGMDEKTLRVFKKLRLTPHSKTALRAVFCVSLSSEVLIDSQILTRKPG